MSAMSAPRAARAMSAPRTPRATSARQQPCAARASRATSGESITEVLVAILVGALAALLLAVAVNSATSITRRSTAFEEHAAASVSAAEKVLAGTGAGTSAGTLTVGFGGTNLPGGTNNPVSVNAYTTGAPASEGPDPNTSSTQDTAGYEDLLVFTR